MPAPGRFLLRLLPGWILRYPRQRLAEDLVAGLIVAFLALPQSLAYALLAGLPPQVGLYVSILPAIAYAWVGSSMVQAVGPVAITAIMTYTVLQPLATPGTPEYAGLAASLALLSGVLLTIGSLLRLGFLSQLLSRPVIQGFISGSAVLILLSQSRHLLGLESGSDSWPGLWAALLAQLAGGLGPAALIGLVALAVLALGRTLLEHALVRCGMAAARAKFIVRLLPLMVIAAASAVVLHFNLEARGIAVVGPLASGLPDFHWFLPDHASLGKLAVPAMLLALVGMVQNIAMAQALAIKRHERVDANSELLGLGAANMVAAVYGGMPVGGGVSRSALNVAAGAQSPLASIVTAATMGVIVYALASFFSHLPLAALAASIMVAAFSMIDLKSWREAWAYDRADGLAWLGTAGGVVFLGLERGIGLGIMLSLTTLLLRASTPHIARLGRIPGSEHFRNTDRHAVETLPEVVFLRIDESLFFGNQSAVEARIASELLETPTLRHVVLVMSAVNRVDTTAMEMLCDINRDLDERQIHLHLAEVKGPVHDRLHHSRLWPALSGQVFLSVNEAFEKLRLAAPRLTVPANKAPSPSWHP
ncbi:MAG: sulP [Proteobacteria bacterium]|nr:sulP [Pseudomonadota bacterium]